jgi:hypothetical protein
MGMTAVQVSIALITSTAVSKGAVMAHSVESLGYGLQDWAIMFRLQARTALEPNQPPNLWVLEASSPGGRGASA